MQLDRDYWEERYTRSETGWDIGSASTPLKEYLDQLTDKQLQILIPGAGRAYEAEYAHRSGFKNVYVIDLTDAPFADLLERYPEFPKDHLITGDLFTHRGSYDLILEQTFFCALDPGLREKYVNYMYQLLKPGGKLVGVLFDDPLNSVRPPYGGSRAEYELLFGATFKEFTLERCINSIPPRADRELWLRAVNDQAQYLPIDCSLYDHYEAAASLGRTIEIVQTNGARAQSKIKDLFIRGGIEWMELADGTEIRLDLIDRMEGIDES